MVRPGYQPGKQLSKNTTPSVSVTCLPRKYRCDTKSASLPVQKATFSLTLSLPEYLPTAAVCQTSTTAPATGWQASSRTRRAIRMGNPFAP